MTSGDSAYSKKQNTELRASPSPDAEVTAKLGFAEKVTITTVQGRWYEVKAGSKSGWVYAGNLAAKEPPAENKADLFGSSAGETTASTAARPLSQAAEAYGTRQNHSDAVADLKWLESSADAITPAQVADYARQNHRGQYQ